MEFEKKLLIVPCCKSKNGRSASIQSRSIDEFISEETSSLLHQSRRLAFERPQTWLNNESFPAPALFRYSGTMYCVEGFRDAVRYAVDGGMHVLVESGGYGLIRIEEPICNYEAQMNRTAPIWRHVLPKVLADYISRNKIEQVFVAGSKSYLSVLRRSSWWEPANCRWFLSYVGRGNGNAYEIVPQNLGIAVRDLIQSKLQFDTSWVE